MHKAASANRCRFSALCIKGKLSPRGCGREPEKEPLFDGFYIATLGDVTVLQYALVAAVAFLAAAVGGVAGYGTGLLLPPILLPIVGPQAVVVFF